MFKKPDIENLLHIARETFVTEILPHVPPDKRYVAAMIGNAMAIAMRQSAGEELETQQNLLKAVYGDDTSVDWQTFSDDLRSGKISEQTHPELLTQMMASLRQELSVSNPKFSE